MSGDRPLEDWERQLLDPHYRPPATITKYCRWCNEPFDTFTACHHHQSLCSKRNVHSLDERRRRDELTIRIEPMPPL
jgi:hypothetical protein